MYKNKASTTQDQWQYFGFYKAKIIGIIGFIGIVLSFIVSTNSSSFTFDVFAL